MLRDMPLPAHEQGGDKETRGRILIVGGSAEVPGGELLAGIGALRAGGGKLQIATCAQAALSLATAMPEARVFVDDDEQLGDAIRSSSVVVIGPGMTDADHAQHIVRLFLATPGQAPAVLDAAALAGVAPGRRPIILTPHAGEMAKLMNTSKSAVEADPRTVALAACERFGATVVLKGATTYIVSSNGRRLRHDGGLFGLATSGSGDVLAGVIGGLLARGADLVTACAWGVFAHAEAGRRLSARIGRLGFLAREILDEIAPIITPPDQPTP